MVLRGVQSLLSLLILNISTTALALTAEEAVDILMGSEDKERVQQVYQEFANGNTEQADHLLQKLDIDTFLMIPKSRLRPILVDSSVPWLRFTEFDFDIFPKETRKSWKVFFACIEIEKSRRRFAGINRPGVGYGEKDRRKGYDGTRAKTVGGALIAAASYVPWPSLVSGAMLGLGAYHMVKHWPAILREVNERSVDRAHLRNLVAVLNFVHEERVGIDARAGNKIAEALKEVFDANHVTYAEHIALYEAYRRLVEYHGVIEDRAALSQLRDVESSIRRHPHLLRLADKAEAQAQIITRDRLAGLELGVRFDPQVDVLNHRISARQVQGAWVVTVPAAWKDIIVTFDPDSPLSEKQIEELLPYGVWIRYPRLGSDRYFLVPLLTDKQVAPLPVTEKTFELEVWNDPWAQWGERLGVVKPGVDVSAEILKMFYARFQEDQRIKRLPWGVRQPCQWLLAQKRFWLGENLQTEVIDRGYFD